MKWVLLNSFENTFSKCIPEHISHILMLDSTVRDASTLIKIITNKMYSYIKVTIV